MFKKRKVATPGLGHTPYNPLSGDHANLNQEGTWPFCAMMQVAADDTYDDYVICRGFDPRILRFIDYESGNDDKPGISVAKPFGKRTSGTYEIGEVYPALLPTQGGSGVSDFKQVNYTPPSPTAVQWRVGQNPGVTVGGLDGGQPEDLDDEIAILRDHNGKAVNWLLVDSGSGGFSSKLVYATSGIPARSGVTPGSATCTEYKMASGDYATNTNTLTVLNHSAVAVPTGMVLMASYEGITGTWGVEPAIVGLRISSTNLQYTVDGTTWVTWATATTCPP